MKKIKPLSYIYKILLDTVNIKEHETIRGAIVMLFESKKINLEEMITLDRDYFYNKTELETSKEFVLRRSKELKNRL